MGNRSRESSLNFDVCAGILNIYIILCWRTGNVEHNPRKQLCSVCFTEEIGRNGPQNSHSGKCLNFLCLSFIFFYIYSFTFHFYVFIILYWNDIQYAQYINLIWKDLNQINNELIFNGEFISSIKLKCNMRQSNTVYILFDINYAKKDPLFTFFKC